MNDGAEFDTFYAATAPRLVRHVYLATGDLQRAQDCVQEAYTRAWRRWDQFGEADADPVAWVRTVAWRLAVNDWRRAVAGVRALVRHGPIAPVPEPSADVVAVRTAIDQLPRDQQVAIVLHYFSGLRVREIADVLHVPEGTVKARLSRARMALAPLLADNEEATWTRK